MSGNCIGGDAMKRLLVCLSIAALLAGCDEGGSSTTPTATQPATTLNGEPWVAAPGQTGSDAAHARVWALPDVAGHSDKLREQTNGAATGTTRLDEPLPTDTQRGRCWVIGFFEDRNGELQRVWTFQVSADTGEVFVKSDAGVQTLDQWRSSR